MTRPIPASTTSPPELALELPAIAYSVPGVRHAVTRYARQAGAGELACRDIALAVSEAVGNAVVHAYAETAREPVVRVVARCDGDRIEVRVRDEGSGLQSRADSPGLGLGLPLMASLADDLDLRAVPGRGTEVVLGFELRAVGGPAVAAA